MAGTCLARSSRYLDTAFYLCAFRGPDSNRHLRFTASAEPLQQPGVHAQWRDSSFGSSSWSYPPPPEPGSRYSDWSHQGSVYRRRPRYDQSDSLRRRGLHVLTSSSPAGNLRSLNDLAKSARADYIIHTGDFGFYDDSSLERIAEKWVVASKYLTLPN